MSDATPPIPDAVPHCLICQARGMAHRNRCGVVPDMIATEHADALIARAMTVEASKMYALLHYRAELDAPH